MPPRSTQARWETDAIASTIGRILRLIPRNPQGPPRRTVVIVTAYPDLDLLGRLLICEEHAADLDARDLRLLQLTGLVLARRSSHASSAGPASCARATMRHPF